MGAKEQIQVQDAEEVIENVIAESLASGDGTAVANTLDALMSSLLSVSIDIPDEEDEDVETEDTAGDTDSGTSAGAVTPPPPPKKKKQVVSDEKSQEIMSLLVDTIEQAPTPAVLSSVVGGISNLVLINADEDEEDLQDQGGTGDQNVGNDGNGN